MPTALSEGVGRGLARLWRSSQIPDDLPAHSVSLVSHEMANLHPSARARPRRLRHRRDTRRQGAAGVTGKTAPSLVFTVAITGHQDIPPARHAHLQRQVGEVLAVAHRELRTRAADSLVDKDRPLQLRFVSALAPGADQVGARAALAAAERGEGWQLEAILPFAVPAYQYLARQTLAARKADSASQLTSEAIAAAVDPIPDLAAQAGRMLELADWQPAPDEPERSDWAARRYATIGQMLVRRCDLLIAIWDGLPPRGRGGTADVVTEARRSGVPVVWILPDSPDAVHSILPGPASASVTASDVVIGWRAAQERGESDSSINPGADTAVARAVQQVLLGHDEARRWCIERYLGERPTKRWTRRAASGGAEQDTVPGDTFRAYALMLYLFLRWPSRAMTAQRVADEPPKPLRSWPLQLARRAGTLRVWRNVLLYPFGFGVERGEPGSANAAPLLDHAAEADALATRLSNQYRSAYVKIFALAPLAVLWAVLSMIFPDWKPGFVCAEIATVGLAAWIYLRTRDFDPVAHHKHPGGRWQRLRARWSQDTHQRWLDARLIAESQRSGQLLAWVGFSGRRPIEEHAAAPHDAHHADHHGHAPRTLWAPHYANAIAALPELPHDAGGDTATRMDPARIALLAAAAGKVIADQRGYHDLNHQRLQKLNHRLDAFSVVMIGIAFVFSLAFLAVWLVNKPGPEGLWPLPAGEGTWLYGLYAVIKPTAALLGAVFPAVAAAAAGIRFQGDFERFAMRSKDTAERLTMLAARAERIAEEASVCGMNACTGRPPLFEVLLDLLLDTQGVLDEDLADWRFAYAARPITLG
jgi:hypothetical protein